VFSIVDITAGDGLCKNRQLSEISNCYGHPGKTRGFEVMLSVDTKLDNPEARPVTCFTGRHNIF